MLEKRLLTSKVIECLVKNANEGFAFYPRN